MKRGIITVNTLKRVLKPVLGIVCAILLNILGNRIVGALKIPLFIDNIGTILASVMGGYLPGIIVGYLTNIVNMTANVDNVYYASISALIAVAAAFFASKGFFEKTWKVVLTIPVFALIGGALGSVLTYLIYGFGMGEGISQPFAKKLLESGTFTVFEAQMLSDVTIDLIDKAVTVIIAYVILMLIPERIKNFFKMTDWRQKPFTKEEKSKSDKEIIKRVSLEAKVTIIISSIMIVIAFVTTSISYLLYHSFAIKEYTQQGQSTATLAASYIDGDDIYHFLKEGKTAPHYEETLQKLEKIIESTPDIKYLYVYRITESGCHVVFDLADEGGETSELGTVIPFDESFTNYIPSLLLGKSIDPIISDDTYGWLLTNYEPVYDSFGKCACYAATDISMSDVRVEGISFVTKIASLFAGFFLLILALVMWFAKYHLVYPINAMTLASSEFIYNNEHDRNESIKRIKALKISTGDEIENLYEAISKMIADTVSHLNKIKRKERQISILQNCLITVLADVVESRDQNTGDHIKKTAAYSRLLLKCMKKKGIHSDIITDDYIEDVANSAPLHDIGKIVVPDAVLNKAGRLDDEEYKIMKEHAKAGRQIIDKAMKLVPNSGYLKEARHLASYHHEKWDGSGYPEGLSGENIPLSARIMAVADVLDALLSKRCYKPPMDFDKAIDIIKEGSGKHFDPEIVDVLLDNLPAFKAIADEHNETYNAAT